MAGPFRAGPYYPRPLLQLIWAVPYFLIVPVFAAAIEVANQTLRPAKKRRWDMMLDAHAVVAHLRPTSTPSGHGEAQELSVEGAIAA